MTKQKKSKLHTSKKRNKKNLFPYHNEDDQSDGKEQFYDDVDDDNENCDDENYYYDVINQRYEVSQDDDDEEDLDHEGDSNVEIDDRSVVLTKETIGSQTDDVARRLPNNSSCPSSSIRMFPMFSPPQAKTTDFPRPHTNKTYVRPNVPSRNSQPLSSTNKQSDPTTKAQSKSNAHSPPSEFQLIATNHVLKNKIKQLSIAVKNAKATTLLPNTNSSVNSRRIQSTSITETSFQLLMKGQDSVLQLINNMNVNQTNCLKIVNGLVDRKKHQRKRRNSTISPPPAGNLILKPPTLSIPSSTFMIPPNLSIPNYSSCSHYQNGTCRYGDKCRFSHITMKV